MHDSRKFLPVAYLHAILIFMEELFYRSVIHNDNEPHTACAAYELSINAVS